MEEVIDVLLLAEQKGLQPPHGIPADRWFSRIALGMTKPKQNWGSLVSLPQSSPVGHLPVILVLTIPGVLHAQNRSCNDMDLSMVEQGA